MTFFKKFTNIFLFQNKYHSILKIFSIFLLKKQELTIISNSKIINELNDKNFLFILLN